MPSSDGVGWADLKRKAYECKALGDLNGAIAYLAQALQQARALPNAVEVVGTMWNSLAVLYQSTGDLEEAERAARECLGIRRVLSKKDDPRLGSALMFLARLLAIQGRFDEAHPLAEEGVAVYGAAHGENHPVTNQCRDALIQIAERDFREPGGIKGDSGN